MNDERPGRLGVGVIGSGKVGAVLGSALRQAGHSIVGVSAASEASLERAETLLPGVPVLDIPTVVERAELVLLAVPDDSLEPLVAGLAETGAWQPGQLVAHCSGRYGTDVLRPAGAAGAIPLALHPAMTFTGTSLDIARLADTTFGVTAPSPVLPVAQALVVEMGAEPVVIAEADRAAYHAAIAHASNHTVTVIAGAAELLTSIGVSDPAAVLGPLLHATVDNALDRGQDALTGPVARGDAGTVEAHLAALDEHAQATGSEELLQTYRFLSRQTADRALAAGMIDTETGERLLGILQRRPDR